MSSVGLDRPAKLADWSEAFVLARQRRLSKSKLLSVARAASPDMADEDVGILVSDTYRELNRRSRAAGPLYPFEVERRSLKPVGGGGTAQLYAFMVLLSVDHAHRRRQGSRDVGWWPDLLFEHLVSHALREWTNGIAFVFSELRTGPRRGIRAALRTLGQELSVEVHPYRTRKARKDHGLDVIAWRPFRDGRLGLPLVLCQCTIASSRLERKAREVVPAEWASLMDVTALSLVRAFAVPHVLGVDFIYWNDLRRNTDLILDRLRIMELLAAADDVPTLLAHESFEAAIDDRLHHWLARQEQILWGVS